MRSRPSDSGTPARRRFSRRLKRPVFQPAFALLLLPLICCVSAVAQKPELVVQTGHYVNTTEVAFSPDGKVLASASYDKTVKLWDVATGQELRTLTGHGDFVHSVAFSPDGKTLASASGDKTIRLWDFNGGALLQTLKGHGGGVSAVAFGPGGKLLASASQDNTVKLWEVATGRELRTFEGHTAGIECVAFSPDGRTLASGGGVLKVIRKADDTVRLWDVATGQQSASLVGHTDVIHSVAFSPDGKTLASASKDKTVRLWDAAAGRPARTLAGHSHFVNSVAFSPDGKLLVSASEDKTIKFWDAATGNELKTLAGHSAFVTTVALSPDGRTLASGSGDNTIRLWEVATGRELRALAKHTAFVNSVAFSPNGKAFAFASGDKTVKLWDTASGQQSGVLAGHTHVVKAVAFSPDGRLLASAGFDKTVRLWDAAAGRELRVLKGHAGTVHSVTFTPDGKVLASASDDKTVKLWDVATGRELHTLAGHTSPVNSVAAGAGGVLASGSADGTVRLWDVAEGKLLRVLRGGIFYINSVALSPDGKLVAGGGFGQIKLWEVATGQELRTLSAHSQMLIALSFSPDGRTLASGGGPFGDEAVRLWDVSSGKELRTFTGHAGLVSSLAFAGGGQVLASGSWDTTVKLWDVATGEELLSLISVERQDWLTAAPDGLFDGSQGAWAKILWRFSPSLYDLYPVEAFFNEFYRPGLLAEVLAGSRPRALLNLAQRDRRQPRLSLSLRGVPSTGANVSTRSVTVRVELTQAPAGARDVRLFRNGSLVRVWRGDVLRGRDRVTLAATVPVVAGENRLTAYAFNRDNVKSADAGLTVTGAESLRRKGAVHILAIGINIYRPNLFVGSLRYAVADAQEFGGELMRQQQRLGRFAPVEVSGLYDRAATKAGILRALARLAAKVQPEDALVVFYAGHGAASGDRFFFISHDLGLAGGDVGKADAQALVSRNISDRDFERAFERIDAGQILLVIDACNSGQALESEEKRRGPMNSKGLAQLAYEKGMYVLTAAQSYQAALEVAQLGHGLLTYALVEEGLKTPAADVEPRDGNVLVREWLSYAERRVPEMQLDKMRRSLSRGVDLSFAEEERGFELGKRSGQRPRVFLRRELEDKPFIVAGVGGAGGN